MLAIIHLSREALTDPPSLAVLATMAAEHELVLVCDQCESGAVLPALRTALPRRQVVALLVGGEVARHERRLVEELLEEGAVPVILATEPATRLANWLWLKADASIGLPTVSRTVVPS